MSDEHRKSQFPAYVNGALTAAQRLQVEEHLAGCESCRQALSKLRAKQARVKREALKKAVPDRVPNLLLNRLGKQRGILPKRRPAAWGPLFALLLTIAAFVVIVSRKDFRLSRPPSPNPLSPAVSGPNLPTEAPPLLSSPTLSGEAKNERRHDAKVPDKLIPISSPTAVGATPEPDDANMPREWKGLSSEIKEFREVVVKNRSAWRALWEEMGRKEPAPRIRFINFVLVGVFLGEKPSGSEVTLFPAIEDGQEMIVPYKVTAPPSGSSAKSELVRPYHLMTIPRTHKKIRFSK